MIVLVKHFDKCVGMIVMPETVFLPPPRVGYVHLPEGNTQKKAIILSSLPAQPTTAGSLPPPEEPSHPPEEPPNPGMPEPEPEPMSRARSRSRSRTPPRPRISDMKEAADRRCLFNMCALPSLLPGVRRMV